MTADHLLRQAKLPSHVAHFVLEQFPQRLDELELHSRFEAADVVVSLDCHRRTSTRGEWPDDFPFLFRIFHTCKATKELLFRVDRHQFDSQVRAEGSFNLIALVKSKQS